MAAFYDPRIKLRKLGVMGQYPLLFQSASMKGRCPMTPSFLSLIRVA